MATPPFTDRGFARSDDELFRAFVECTLPQDEWTHVAHVRVAYLFARRFRMPKALDEVRRSIRAYNAATETPETIDRGYHETITQAFMRLISTRTAHVDLGTDSRGFCRRFPEMLNKRVLLEYYSRHRLMTWEAKIAFVEPDRGELR